MLGPNEEETRRAAELGIDIRGMSGRQVRYAFVQYRERAQRAGVGTEARERWARLCEELGITVPTWPFPPDIAGLQRLFNQRLTQLMAERGIVPGARLTIPPQSRLTVSGRATVGQIWPPNSEGMTVVTLTFDGRPAHTYNAHLVWKDAKNIRRPRVR